MSEHTTWIYVSIKDSLEQELFVISCYGSSSTCYRYVLGKGRTKSTVIVVRHPDKSHATSIVKHTQSLLNSRLRTNTLKCYICSTAKNFTHLSNTFFSSFSYNSCRS